MSARQVLPFCLFAIVVNAVCVIAFLCDDLSKDGCAAFDKVKPDLCNDPFFSANCRRLCKQCPLECYHCPFPVRDPDMCNETQPCGVNQTCVLGEVLAIDGHNEYIMSCTDKRICNGFPLGIDNASAEILRKRDMDAGNDISQRNVSITCCDTDNCNKDLIFATTTQTTPTTTAETYTGCGKDIAVTLDTSGSIGPTNVQHMLDFVSQIISIIEIGPHQTQVALDTFATRVTVHWFLHRYSTRDTMLKALRAIQYRSGTTRTDDALKHIIISVLTPQLGDRPNAKNVVLVVTDGHSTIPNATIAAAKQLHDASTDIIAVGIGAHIDHEELTAIATNSKHVINITDFNLLPSIVSRVVGLLCA